MRQRDWLFQKVSHSQTYSRLCNVKCDFSLTSYAPSLSSAGVNRSPQMKLENVSASRMKPVGCEARHLPGETIQILAQPPCGLRLYVVLTLSRETLAGVLLPLFVFIAAGLRGKLCPPAVLGFQGDAEPILPVLSGPNPKLHVSLSSRRQPLQGLIGMCVRNALIDVDRLQVC